MNKNSNIIQNTSYNNHRKKQSDGGCWMHHVTAVPFHVALFNSASDELAGHPADIRRSLPVHYMRAIITRPQDEYQKGTEGLIGFFNFFAWLSRFSCVVAISGIKYELCFNFTGSGAIFGFVRTEKCMFVYKK